MIHYFFYLGHLKRNTTLFIYWFFFILQKHETYTICVFHKFSSLFFMFQNNTFLHIYMNWIFFNPSSRICLFRYEESNICERYLNEPTAKTLLI